jgi:hypothetical protein
MSILDDAIREHLELKRAHGADDAELKKLEDEAFGPPARPDESDPFAEAPTEFLTAPATGADEAAADAAKGGPSGRREPNIGDLQEAPEPPKAPEPAEEAEAPAEEEQPAIEQTMPVPHAEESQPEPESAPAPEPEIDAGHSTEERHAIAEQPTELFDVEADLDTGSEPRSPSDEELVDAEMSEPRLAPVDPLGGIVDTGPDAEVAHPPEDEDDDDFFSEQRLSDELDQALEAPLTDEHPAVAPAEPAGPPTEEHDAPPPPPPAEEATAIYNLEDDAEHAEAAEIEFDDEDDDEPGPQVEEEDKDEEPAAAAEPPAAAQPEEAEKPEDVLEDTPDFLEDAPEDDDLWFEQKPPKDFDFDD